MDRAPDEARLSIPSVLVDTRLLLEFFINRDGRAQDAEKLLFMVEAKQVNLYITEWCLDAIYQLFHKAGEQVVSEVIEQIEAMCNGRIISIDEEGLKWLRQAPLHDSISAFELACAVHHNLGAIVTQTPESYEGSCLPVLQVNQLQLRQPLYRLLEPGFLMLTDVQNLESFIEVNEGKNSRTDAFKEYQQEQTKSSYSKYIQKPAIVNLAQWMLNIFEGGWKQYTSYTSTLDITATARGESVSNIAAVRSIDLGKESICLIVIRKVGFNQASEISGVQEGEISVLCQVRPLEGHTTLPSQLSLHAYDVSGIVCCEVCTEEANTYTFLSTPHLYLFPGEEFSIVLTLGNVAYTQIFRA